MSKTHKRNRKHKGTQKKYKKSSSKKWVTAIKAAQSTLKETGSLQKAKLALKKQALFNARKLFGSV